MAKLALEAVTDIYKLIVSSPLNTELNGNVFKYSRPNDLSVDAIVINSLPMTGDSLQECIINVNVFVRNASLQLFGKTDTSQPNSARLITLSKMVYEMFDNLWINGFSVWIEQEYTIDNAPLAEHYQNFRLMFKNNK